ncbi:MAG: hypothetical protein R2749_06675 [Acidimicrobiales bacterium]
MQQPLAAQRRDPIQQGAHGPTLDGAEAVVDPFVVVQLERGLVGVDAQPVVLVGREAGLPIGVGQIGDAHLGRWGLERVVAPRQPAEGHMGHAHRATLVVHEPVLGQHGGLAGPQRPARAVDPTALGQVVEVQLEVERGRPVGVGGPGAEQPGEQVAQRRHRTHPDATVGIELIRHDRHRTADGAVLVQFVDQSAVAEDRRRVGVAALACAGFSGHDRAT